MDLFKIVYSNYVFNIQISLIIVLSALVIFAIILTIRNKNLKKTPNLVSMEIEVGSKGVNNKFYYQVEKNEDNIYIANRIYLELITRKAAIEIEPENDVIEEVYNSWYELFKIIRTEIKNIPGSLFANKNNTTKELMKLTIKILNEGLRPHLTYFQAEFKKWYKHAKELKENENLSPQDIQKKYPKYEELIDDMKNVNKILQVYANQLEKLIYEKE